MRLKTLIRRLQRQRSRSAEARDRRPDESKPRPVPEDLQDWESGMFEEFRELYDGERRNR